MDKAYVVPLHELLAGVPRGTRLEINDPDGMGTRFIPVGRYCHEAAEALRAALAQPEPEPVAWISHNAGLYHGKPDESLNPLPLYTAPPQREWMEQERAVGYREGHQAALKQRVWQGLTDDEIAEIGKIWLAGNRMLPFPLARAIEAKLKEKNA